MPSNYGLEDASFHELDLIKEARKRAWQEAVREAYGDEELVYDTLEAWQDALREWAVEHEDYTSEEALKIASESEAVRPFRAAVERATRARVDELERQRNHGRPLVTPSWDKETRKAIEKNLEHLREAEAEKPKDPTPIIRTSIQPKK